MKIKSEDFNYYFSEKQKERWHDALFYFEKISVFYKIQAQKKRIQKYIRQYLKILTVSQPVSRIQNSEILK